MTPEIEQNQRPRWREHFASEELARAAVVAEARGWVGTPWAHAHDCKGGGVDCAMLLCRVFADTGLIPAIDPRPYPSQWFLHHEASRFLNVVGVHGHQVERAQPGDIAMYCFGKHPAHGALVVDDDYMIHAYLPSGRVILDSRKALIARLDSLWSLF